MFLVLDGTITYAHNDMETPEEKNRALMVAIFRILEFFMY